MAQASLPIPAVAIAIVAIAAPVPVPVAIVVVTSAPVEGKATSQQEEVAKKELSPVFRQGLILCSGQFALENFRLGLCSRLVCL